MVRTPPTRHGSHTPPRRRTRPFPPPSRAAGWPLAVSVFLLSLALAALPARAATTTNPESLPIPEGSASPTAVGDGAGGGLLRLGVGLLVVVGLIVLVWQVMKRAQRSRYPALDDRGPSLIDVVSTTTLGPGRALHLVRVGEELVLVGATDHGVTTLARIGAEDAAAVVDVGPAPRGPAGPDARPGYDDVRRARETAGIPHDPRLLARLRALTERR